MKTIQIALAALVIMALAACSTTGTIMSPDKPRLDAPDTVSLRGCELPVKLPAGKMTQRDIETYWGLDRTHQIDCAKRHKILADYIKNRDAALRG